MKGTIISIVIGALVGALLSIGSTMHASHALASAAAATLGEHGSGVAAAASDDRVPSPWARQAGGGAPSDTDTAPSTEPK